MLPYRSFVITCQEYYLSSQRAFTSFTFEVKSLTEKFIAEATNNFQILPAKKKKITSYPKFLTIPKKEKSSLS